MSGQPRRVGPRLRGCQVAHCEARCCYDGVYLMAGEEEFLRELVSKVPALREVLPAEFITDGWWQGEYYGRKTATRPHAYRSADFPAHFAPTRCVFADAVGYCRLESFARQRGQHPWTFKPATCWLFPLHVEDGKPVPPVTREQDDPYRTEGYAGYSTFVPCGRHDPNGRPWRQALATEIDYLAQAPRIPLLGSAGRSVDELLAAGRKKTPPEGGVFQSQKGP
jgi:hypothetical protein